MDAAYLLGLASPRQYRRLPSRGRRGKAVWWSKPRAAAYTQIALAGALIEANLPVAVLPPIPRPVKAVFEAAAWDDGDHAETIRHEASLWAYAHPGDDDAVGLIGTVIPAHLQQSQQLTLVIAGHRGNASRAAWAQASRARLTAVVKPDVLAIHDAISLLGTWSDPGQANVLHLRGDDPQHDRLLAVHHRAESMPKVMQPRKGPMRADAEAQRAALRTGLLRQGHALFARQLWTATDAGAEYLDQITCVGDRLLLTHQLALGDSHEVLLTVERAVPGLRVRQVDQRSVSLERCIRSGLLAGVLASTGNQQNYFVSASAVSGTGGRWLQDLKTDGLINDIIPVDGDHDALGGSLARCLLRLPGLTSADFQATYLLNAARLEQLKDWASEFLPEECLPERITDVKSSDLCHQADRALQAIFTGF